MDANTETGDNINADIDTMTQQNLKCLYYLRYCVVSNMSVRLMSDINTAFFLSSVHVSLFIKPSIYMCKSYTKSMLLLFTYALASKHNME